ncbi:MAG: phage major capsid protein [Bacteroidota bacterium]
MEKFKEYLKRHEIDAEKSTFKNYCRFKGVESVSDLSEQEAANYRAEFDQFKAGIQQEVNENLKKELAESREEVKELKEQQEKQGEVIQDLKNGSAKATVKWESFDTKMEQIHEDFKGFASGNGQKEFKIPFSPDFRDRQKAVFETTAAVGNRDVMPIERIAELPSPRTRLYDVFPKNPVPANANGTISYDDYDDTNSVRGAEMYAENNPTPQSTAQMVNRVAKLKKVGDSMPITQEAAYDTRRFSQTLQRFLTRNVDLKVDQQLATGDGLGQNLLGIMNSVAAYTVPNSGIQDANIFDLNNHLATDIENLVGGSYQANFGFINTVDFNNLFLSKKDGENNYLTPPWASTVAPFVINSNGVLIYGASKIPSGQMVIGDSEFAEIYEEPGIFLERGLDDGDWRNDRMSFKVRRRMLFLIRVLDQTGFRRIPDIGLALAALGA